LATIVPFRAVRYNREKINGPVDAVVAPPYDVISAEQQDALYKRSPHNVVRLILGRQYDGDSPTDNRYTRAAKTWSQWQDEEVLVSEKQPAFYVYEQQFEVSLGHPPRKKSFTRRGVLSALKLEPFGEGCVFPHEETFPAHKADRLQLFSACRANFSPVFGLVPDEGDVTALLAKVTTSRAPDVEIREESGVLNRLWVVSEKAFCKQLAGLLEPRKVFIADGHHRYETACNYRNERRAAEKGKAKGNQAYDHVLMMCVPMSDPGLVILPTHRLVQSGTGLAADEFLKKAEAFFTSKETSESELAALAETQDGPVRYGAVAAGGRKVLLTAKPSVADAMKKAAPAKSEAWRGLDTAILHEVVLKQLLGLGKGPATPHSGIEYTKDVGDVFKRVASGACGVGFVLRPSRMDQVRATAENGERMPQKSTYFSPKLLSGLVMRKL
jgi:uncharacterized protein (DUF1015 family)